MNGYIRAFLMFSSFYAYHINCAVTTLSGTIQFATTQPLVEPVIFKMHCNGVGDITYTGEGSTDYQHQYFTFRLPPIQTHSSLHVLITERLSLPQKHELPLTNLKTHPEYQYKLFKLMLNESYNKESNCWEYKWNIQELENTITHKAIPENTIIVFMPPTLFERFSCSEKPMKHNHAKNFIKLPTLHTVKANSDIIVQASKESASTSCDFNSLLKNTQESIILCDAKHTVSLPTPTNTYKRPWV